MKKLQTQKFPSNFPRCLIISALINTPITAEHEIFKHSLIANAETLALYSRRDICFQLALTANGCIIFEIGIELFSLIKFVLAGEQQWSYPNEKRTSATRFRVNSRLTLVRVVHSIVEILLRRDCTWLTV